MHTHRCPKCPRREGVIGHRFCTGVDCTERHLEKCKEHR